MGKQSKLELMEVDCQITAQLIPNQCIPANDNDYIEVATFYLGIDQFDRILEHFLVLESLGKASRVFAMTFVIHYEPCEVVAEISKVLMPID